MTDSAGPAPAGLATVLLQLLRAEAPVEQFEDLVAGAHTDDPGSTGTLRSTVRLALEVRELLATRARRERELAALYETAGDLSSLRELEPVLQAIVRRAYELVGCDATYLMLNDPARGRTWMRVTEGIRTAAFQQAELALGAGLGGLVAASGHPYATADYASDRRFVHTIDPIVGDEGLVAILGVPLKLGDRVIGVLFAANRRSRPFADEEAALLGSLAAHAAIALENASLFSDLRKAFEDLRHANAVIQAHSEAVERAAAMHERLTGLVLGGRGLPEVVQSVVQVLGGGLLLFDGTERLLACAGDGLPAAASAVVAEGRLPGGPEHARLREAVLSAQAARRTLRLGPQEDGAPDAYVVVPVVAGSELLGTLLAVGGRLDDMDLRSLERAALVAALLLLGERSVADAEQRVRGELFEDLLMHPGRDEPGLRRRAARLGIALERPHVVLVLHGADEDRRSALLAAGRAVADEEGGLSGEHRGTGVLLLPGADASALAARVGGRLGRVWGGPVTVGAAGPASGAQAVAAAYRDAVRCRDVLLALGRPGGTAAPEDLGVYGLLFSQAGRDELAAFVRRTIGPVLDYDDRRGSDLVRTLSTYFEADRNLARTSAALFVHVNTLYQRLDRVGTLLGEGWRHGDQALQVHLALKVHLALERQPSAAPVPQP